MSDAAAREQTNTEAGTNEPGLRVPFSVDEKSAIRRERLVKLIAAKLVLDLIFVCGLAVYAHSVTFNGGFDGRIVHADGLEVSGWVVDLEQPGAPVEVQLFVNDRFTAAAFTGEVLSNGESVDAAGRGRRAFIFRFEQPQYGEYQMRVYAVREGRAGARRTLQQIGEPANANFR